MFNNVRCLSEEKLIELNSVLKSIMDEAANITGVDYHFHSVTYWWDTVHENYIFTVWANGNNMTDDDICFSTPAKVLAVELEDLFLRNEFDSASFIPLAIKGVVSWKERQEERMS